MSDILGDNIFQGVHMILTSGDSISIFYRLLPYTIYLIPVAAFIIAVVVGLYIRNKACRIERDYTRTSADITSVRRISKRTHVNYEYRDQSGILHNVFLSVHGITNYNSMSSIILENFYPFVMESCNYIQCIIFTTIIRNNYLIKI